MSPQNVSACAGPPHFQFSGNKFGEVGLWKGIGLSLTNTLARTRVVVAQHRRVGQVLIVTDVSVGPDALVRGQVGSEAEKGRLFRWLLDMGSDSVGMGSDLSVTRACSGWVFVFACGTAATVAAERTVIQKRWKLRGWL